MNGFLSRLTLALPAETRDAVASAIDSIAEVAPQDLPLILQGYVEMLAVQQHYIESTASGDDLDKPLDQRLWEFLGLTIEDLEAYQPPSACGPINPET